MDNLHEKEIDQLELDWTNIKYLSLLYICARDLHQFECVVVPVTCRSSISKIQRKDLVKEYGTVMKKVKQCNMANREIELAIGEELQTLFHPIVNATKQAAEESRKELESMKKTLADIDGALTAQRVEARPPLSKNNDTTFGIHRRQDGTRNGKQSSTLDVNRKTLPVDDAEYKITPGLRALIALKHPQPSQWNSNDYKAYKSLVAQSKVKSQPNRTDTARPHAAWKWKHMLKKMVIPGESIAEEESEDIDDSVESYPATASIEDIGESSDMLSPDTPGPSIPSPTHTRSYGKTKKTMDREPFYKGYGVVYLPGDTNGLSKKLHSLAAELSAGNTTVRNELVHVVDALLRLKQLPRKEYAGITARLAASL